MRMEAKVYMSHTDMYRIQEAAKRLGMTTSGFLRWCALQAAEATGVPEYTSILEGQRELSVVEEASQLISVGGGE